jgi:hypothetical protein
MSKPAHDQSRLIVIVLDDENLRWPLRLALRHRPIRRGTLQVLFERAAQAGHRFGRRLPIEAIRRRVFEQALDRARFRANTAKANRSGETGETMHDLPQRRHGAAFDVSRNVLREMLDGITPRGERGDEAIAHVAKHGERMIRIVFFRRSIDIGHV